MTTFVGKAIRQHRRRLDLTQAELAEKLGVSRVTVSLWETGESDPTEENLQLLADLFHVQRAVLRYPSTETGSPMRVSEAARPYQAARRMAPAVYEVVFGYLERMRKAGCEDQQISEAERLMSDAAYSQLYSRSRRAKTEEDQVMDIHAAWKFIAEVIERTEGKRL